ncbi:hypothetical protein B296_00000858, partial [Ensete ventricosum]
MCQFGPVLAVIGWTKWAGSKLARPYVASTRTAHYRAVPSKIDCRRLISAVDSRLREKSTIDGRLSEKKGRRRRRRGKEEKKKRGEEERIPSARVSLPPVDRQCPCAVFARAPSPPAGRGRFISRTGRKIEA